MSVETVVDEAYLGGVFVLQDYGDQRAAFHGTAVMALSRRCGRLFLQYHGQIIIAAEFLRRIFEFIFVHFGAEGVREVPLYRLSSATAL